MLNPGSWFHRLIKSNQVDYEFRFHGILWIRSHVEKALYRTYNIQEIILTIYCMLIFPVNVFVVEVACYN